jgi:hypothetical protein
MTTQLVKLSTLSSTIAIMKVSDRGHVFETYSIIHRWLEEKHIYDIGDIVTSFTRLIL